ncbi:MAG: linear amide C-N hydrolase [Lentisphaerae bacterium]|jgi:ubiquitin|nr:linear amide C-N hydrolase [Lentisphaerota bacterium]
MQKLITVIVSTIMIELMACTAWVTAPDVSANGKLFIHKTRDWGKGKEIPVTLRHETAPGGQYKMLAFSPYMLFNEKGLGMIDLALPKTTDYPEDESKLQNIGTTMQKVASSCATVQEALAKMTKMTQDGSNPKTDTYILCDTREAVIIEISPKHIAHQIITRGVAVHTNHFIFPEMACISKGTVDGAIKSATRLHVTTGLFIDKMKEHGKISIADSVDVSRFHDNEKYPEMCPFRNSTVCASDYIPDAEYPDVLGTVNIVPGPTCYAVAIPIPMGIKKIPAVLENGDFGKLAYKLKRSKIDDKALKEKFLPIEENFRKEYEATLDTARKLLKDNKREDALELLQKLTDKQVAEAYALMQGILEQADN